MGLACHVDDLFGQVVHDGSGEDRPEIGGLSNGDETGSEDLGAVGVDQEGDRELVGIDRRCARKADRHTLASQQPDVRVDDLHTVEFDYRPWTVRIGGIVSGLSVLGLVAYLAARRWRQA